VSGEKNTRALALLALHVLLLIYSLSGFFSKNASMHEFLSVPFCAFYFGMLCILGIYAIGWQQILRHLPLTLAFANKGITVVWGIVWGYVFFHETVTLPKLVGAVMILAGVALFSYADAREAQDAGNEADVGGGIDV
jgi:drug/metabolite transporter (DMT)-like permease